MADMVTNILTFEGQRNDLEKIFKFIDTGDKVLDFKIVDCDKRVLDFNSIIPMPKSLDVECSSRTKPALFAYLSDWGKIPFEEIPESAYTGTFSYRSTLPKDFAYNNMLTLRNGDLTEDEKQSLYSLGKQVAYNLAKYKDMTWYEWRITNWGTKWNTYQITATDIGKHVDGFARGYTFQTAYDVPVPIYTALKKYILDNKLNVTFDVSAFYDCNNEVAEFCMEDLTEDFNLEDFKYVDEEEEDI